jgi:hypothetical protein
MSPETTEDSVLYDTPLEFVASAIQRDECAAQSVIPRGDGTYACGCSCERWEATAPSLEEGLRLARAHTGSAQPAEALSATAQRPPGVSTRLKI